MIEALHAAMSDEAARLNDAARAIGGRIDFDPRVALARDLPLDPPGRASANRHCRMIATRDGWIAVNLARPDDRDAVPAWLGCEVTGDLWQTVADGAAQVGTSELLTQAVLLGLPVAEVGESGIDVKNQFSRSHEMRGRLRVVDLSALWAGPYCGALLAEAGCAVTKVESTARSDPTRVSTPDLDRRLNGAKTRIVADFGGGSVAAFVLKAGVLITSARPHALARLGLTPEALFAANPSLIWVAITAHGWTGEAAMRVGFGDDCAAAGGLVDWIDDAPVFVGDALADPLTGLHAARLATEALAGGRCGLIDVALAPTAAMFAQDVQ